MPAAGAYKKEIDLSLYLEIASELKVGIAHVFNKGPIGERTLITNNAALEEQFGTPIDDNTFSQGWLGLNEYLKNGNQAYVVRVESGSNPAVAPKIGLRGATDDTVVSDTDGVTSVPGTRTLTSAGGDFVNDGVLVGDILEVHESAADDGFYVLTNVAATVLTVDRDWPTGSLSDQDFTVWSAKREAGTDGATSAQATRTLTSSGSTFQTNGVQAGDVVYINDTGDTGDNGFYTVASVTSETVLVLNRDFPTGSLTGLTFTVYGANHPAGTDGSTTTDGEFVSSSAQFQAHGVKAGDLLIIEDDTDDGDNDTYVITGLKSGSEDTTLEVNVGTWPTGSLTNLSFRVVPSPVTFTGATEGEWGNDYTAVTSVNSNDSTDFDVGFYDGQGALREAILGLDTTNVASEISANSVDWTAAVVSGRLGPAVAYVGTANGGENGTAGLVDGDLLGSASAKTGLQAFRNREEVLIDLLICPGYTSQNIGDGLLQMAETIRQDCMTILDPPDSPTIVSPQDMIDWHNGTGGFGRTTAINSSHAATYWPWIKTYDAKNDVDRWLAPSGHMASVWAYSENVSYPWIAPAGYKRGLVKGGSDVRYSADVGERNALNSSGNVNPVINEIGTGLVVLGQKTCLRLNSALNRIHVRRMLLYLERLSLDAVKPLTFDPNDDATDRAIVNLLDPGFGHVQANRGLREYLIVPASTDAIRAASKNVTKLFVKPTTAAEIIELQFILTAQSASFEELLSA